MHSALRAANESLRAQVELAKFNDETFKRFCQGEFDAPVTSTERCITDVGKTSGAAGLEQRGSVSDEWD